MGRSANIFEAGNLVAVFGGSIDHDGNKKQQVSVCRIIAVGDKDLLVEESKSRAYFPQPFKIPQSLCISLSLKFKNIFEDRILEPQLGDLVLSFSKERYGEEKITEITGILYEITYRTGIPVSCKLLCDGDFKEVQFDTLLVLQRNVASAKK